jgi:hypothetical protein
MSLVNFHSTRWVSGLLLISLTGVGMVPQAIAHSVGETTSLPEDHSAIPKTCLKPSHAEMGLDQASLISLPDQFDRPVASPSIVLISGRDDHGLLEFPEVHLYHSPGSDHQVASLPDATFAKVLEIRGTWVRVQAIMPPQTKGWIDDFFLRSRASRLDQPEQVAFADARLVKNQVYVAVYPVDGSPDSITWLSCMQLREVGAR